MVIKDKAKIVQYISLVGIALVFFMGFGKEGALLVGDSNNYITMNPGREPLYPLILYVVHCFFNDCIYLNIVILFQALLAVVAVSSFSIYVTIVFRLKPVIGFIILFFTLIPYWIDTIWFAPHVIRTNYILSEGITISLYYLFIIVIFHAILKKKIQDMIVPIFITVLLVLCRSQMLICMAGCGFAIIYIAWKQKWKVWVMGIGYLVFGLYLVVACKNMYNYTFIESTEYVFTNKLAILTNVLYASDQEDAELFEDPNISLIYKEIYKSMIEEKVNYEFVKDKGMVAIADLQHQSHDIIKYNILNNVIGRYQKESDVFQEVGEQSQPSYIIDTLFSTLLKDNWKQWLWNCICLVPIGFMRSIFAARTSMIWFCGIISVTMYTCAIGFMVKGYSVNHKSKEAIFMLLVLILITINVGGLALTILEMTRYLIYNMGLFYIAGFLLLIELTPLKKRMKSKDNI
ncbi:MAG TPA: hypothetical protein VJ083_09135 [Sedimentibacter sp.]|nr:hypothetical protein [Sedimentibacter sp.]